MTNEVLEAESRIHDQLLAAAGITEETPKPTSRQRLHAILEHAEGRTGKTLTALIAFLVVVSVFSLPFELMSRFQPYHTYLYRLEVGIVAFFTLEYLLRLYAAPHRFRYIFSWQGIIDLASIVPFYLVALDVRLLRVLRLARLARVFKIANRHATLHATCSIELLPDEHLEHLAHKHPIVFFLNLLPVIAFIAFGLLAGLLFPTTLGLEILGGFFFFAFLYLVRAWFSYSHDLIYITDLRAIISHGHLFGSETHELFLHEIVDVKAFHPHIFAYLLGYGSLEIETSAGNRQIQLESVIHHEKVQHYLDAHKRGT